jgi:hypothetical protein
MADLVAAGPPEREQVAALASTYGLVFDPTWVPDLMNRYDLNSQSG